MSEVDGYPGVKLLYNGYSLKSGKPAPLDDDKQYPFRLKLVTVPGEFMGVAAVALYGAMPELILGGKTRKALEAFIEGERCEKKPNTIRVILTDPSGTVLREHSK